MMDQSCHLLHRFRHLVGFSILTESGGHCTESGTGGDRKERPAYPICDMTSSGHGPSRPSSPG